MMKVKGYLVVIVLLLSLGLSNVAALGASPKTITIMAHWSQTQQEKVIPILQEYERLNPDVKIVVQGVPMKEFLKKILVSRLGGDTPDIYHIYNLWMPQLVENGVTATPPKNIQALIKKSFTLSAVQGVTQRGIPWGFPTEINDYMLVYNKKLFAEAGISGPPRTWTELLADAKKLTKKDASGNIVQAGFAVRPGDISGVFHPWMSLLWSNGGEFLSKDLKKAAFNSKKGLEATEFFADLVTSTQFSSVDDFIAGKVGMIIFAPWGRLYFQDRMGGNFNDVATAALPASPTGGRVSVAYSWSYVVDKNSEKRPEVWQFLEWLSTKMAGGSATSPMGHYLVDILGAIPSLEKDIASRSDILGNNYNKPFIEGLKYARTEPQLLPAEEVRVEMAKQLEAMLYKQKSAKQALADAENKINEILADYY